MLPYNRNLKQKSRELRNNTTDAERQLWAKIRIPSEAEKTGSVEALIKERGPVGEFTIDDANRYVGAQYSMGKYVYGPTFDKAAEIANSVTWDVACELGVGSEAGETTVKKDMSWTAGR